MKVKNFLLGVYIVLSLVFMVVMVYIIIKKKNCDEKYTQCVCSSGGSGAGSVCQNVEQVQRAYNAGLTENSDLGLLQKLSGGPRWSQISPGDPGFPPRPGCQSCKNNKLDPNGWPIWDFTDFGS